MIIENINKFCQLLTQTLNTFNVNKQFKKQKTYIIYFLKCDVNSTRYMYANENISIYEN